MSYLSRIQQMEAPAATSRPSSLRGLLLVAAFALVAAARLPGVWAEGRFQDEEASVFLAYAWHFPASEAFWRSFGGYWNVIANGIGLLLTAAVKADVVSLERAPYASMLAGLLAQTIPALLLVTGKASWLPDMRARLLGLLLLAFLPGVEEVYLNSLHIQFHLAFACALILALDVPDGRKARILYGIPLGLAPLCGPAAIMLLPLFGLRAYVEHDRHRAYQLLVLALAASWQMLFFYTPSAVRGLAFDPINLLAAISIRMIVFPALGAGIADQVALALEQSILGNRILLWSLASLSASLFGLMLFSMVRHRNSGFWLLSASLLVAAGSLGLGIASTNPSAAFFVSAGFRYNYLPLGLLALALVSSMLSTEGRKRTIYKTSLILFLMVGFIEYSRPASFIASGPSWPGEVAAWRKNPDHLLSVWPEPTYKANLSGKPYDCGLPGARWGSATAPRYCESGWMYQSFGLPEQPRPDRSRDELLVSAPRQG